MRKVFVTGVGMTQFGKLPDESLRKLGATAFWEAVKDADINPKRIEIAYVANSLAGLITGQESLRGQTIFREIGPTGMPIVNVENACASGSTAFFGAWMAVSSGFCDVAVALAAEKMYCGDTLRTLKALATNTDIEMEGRMGVVFPGLYAARIKRYMHEYGVTSMHLAKIAVKNHRNGCLNPYAQYHQEMTVEDVLNSRVIAEPITLYMTCPFSDGAAAAILCSDKISINSRKRRILVAGEALTSGTIVDAQHVDSYEIFRRTAKIAYEQAGLGPDDVDVAEIHDATAASELISYAPLGFCQPEEVGRIIDEGRTEIGGDIPVNTSGGRLSLGHPVGATGLAMICELVWQLRGEAGKRQVEKPKVGLAANPGGNIGGDSGAFAVHILSK